MSEGQNGKGSKQRSGLTQESRSRYDEIDFLKPEEREWLEENGLYINRFEEGIWQGGRMNGEGYIISNFNQRQCFDKLRKYYE